jgi:hypothetical protein
MLTTKKSGFNALRFVLVVICQRVFVSPPAVSVNDLKQCITTAVVSVDENLLGVLGTN